MKNIKQYFKKQREISSTNKNNILGLTSGLDSLDLKTLGYKNKELNLIASRIGYGKTSLALKSVLANLDEGNGVLYFSLDLSNEKLLTRIISMQSCIEIDKLNLHAINDKDEDTLNRVIDKLSLQNLFIDDTKYCDIEYIKNKSNEMISHKENNIKMIVIDYFDLIENDGGTNIARELKKLAIKLDLPIIVLSQLSKKIEKRINQKPKLSDIKDSTLEIEADTVLFIYVDDFVQEHREHIKEIKSLMKDKKSRYKSPFFIKPVVEAQIKVAKQQSDTTEYALKYDLCKPFALFQEKEEQEYSLKTLKQMPRVEKLLSDYIANQEGYNYSQGLPFNKQEHQDIQIMDANNLKLKKIPNEILELINLAVLRLQNNKINKLPNDIESLLKLETLCLCSNKLAILPDVLIKLEALKELAICKNPNLSILPDNFHTLKLTSLSIDGDLINKYSDTVSKITTLKELEIHGGYISKEVFNLLVTLPNLEDLTLDNIENKKFPKTIAKFDKLLFLTIRRSKKFKFYNNNLSSNNFNNIVSIEIRGKELVDDMS